MCNATGRHQRHGSKNSVQMTSVTSFALIFGGDTKDLDRDRDGAALHLTRLNLFLPGRRYVRPSRMDPVHLHAASGKSSSSHILNPTPAGCCSCRSSTITILPIPAPPNHPAYLRHHRYEELHRTFSRRPIRHRQRGGGLVRTTRQQHQ